jgi:hypothetical protein
MLGRSNRQWPLPLKTAGVDLIHPWLQVPYMHDWVNHARAASFTCVLFCAIVLTFSIYHPGIEWDDADGIRDYRQKVG